MFRQTFSNCLVSRQEPSVKPEDSEKAGDLGQSVATPNAPERMSDKLGTLPVILLKSKSNSALVRNPEPPLLIVCSASISGYVTMRSKHPEMAV